MKTSTTILLALSLALNAALAFVVFRPAPPETAAPRATPAVARSARAPEALTSEVWAKLNPDDPKALIEQLRAAG
ncbi:MAG TPA: hypothetical protein VM029_22365, partial [Opitutaceae bacterium]|nr:hypothetical protein [Opitutaceae bacterium]